jgi:hypothetical protein
MTPSSISPHQRNQMLMHAEADLRSARKSMNFWATRENFEQVQEWWQQGCACLATIAALGGQGLEKGNERSWFLEEIHRGSERANDIAVQCWHDKS